MKNQIERAEPSRGATDAAHTPGPWHSFETTKQNRKVSWITGRHGYSGFPFAKVTGDDDSIREANAALIAQAPALLAENENLKSTLNAAASNIKSLQKLALNQKEEFGDALRGHVVLLEALRMAHRYFLQSNKLTVDDREMLDEMWAAIKQAETK